MFSSLPSESKFSMWWKYYRKCTPLLFSIISLIIITIFSTDTTISASSIQTLNEANFVSDSQTLVSPRNKFELKFFKKSNKWYVGIWYKALPDTESANPYVWVANRDSPLSTSDGELKIVNQSIVLLDQNQNPVWWSSSSFSSNITKGKNTYAQLLDNGNFVLRETGDPPDSENYLWQSFDFPTNTLLPGMKLGRNPTTGLDRYLTSWRSPQDPSSGNFSVKLNDNGLPAIIVSEQQGWIKFKSTSWYEIKVSGITTFDDLKLIKETNQEISHWNVLYNYPSFDHYEEGTYNRLFVDEEGVLVNSFWVEGSSDAKWKDLSYKPSNNCDKFAVCPSYSVCDDNTANENCECLRGFTKKTRILALDGNETIPFIYGRCDRKTALVCEEGKFLRLRNTELQDTMSFFDRNMSLKECENRCKENCNCTAYANPYKNGRTGCANWVGELQSFRSTAFFYDEYPGGDIFVRVAASDLVDRISIKSAMATIAIAVTGITIISMCAFYFRKLIVKNREKKRERKETQLLPFRRRQTSSEFMSESQELQIFCFEELVTATDNFDSTNQLGRGGYGPVYKGTLQNGLEIAVKRLSRASRQGVDEFMNEVLVISKLQHVNLVRLLGCCIEGDEKILVYEYMPNKSLHAVLFDSVENGCLDWTTRFNIIEGISRGLLYLHRDSRLPIIHRDLKAANILLDGKMNPKISDFGMAKIFQRNQDQVNTLRVVGTYGYMSPEYAMEGRFSEKSDVYSFGVLLLEIVSGRKNSSFYNDEHCLSLVRYAWKLWNEGNNILDMIDKTVFDPVCSKEALRCIHVGLLCVQDFAEDRSPMSKVVSMLNSEIMNLPCPKQPAFYQQQTAPNARFSSQDQNRSCCSVNDVTITRLQGR